MYKGIRGVSRQEKPCWETPRDSSSPPNATLPPQGGVIPCPHVFQLFLGGLWDAISSRARGALIRTPQMKGAPCSHLVCTTCRSQIPPCCAAAATAHLGIFKQISHKTHPVKTRGKHIPHTQGSWIKTLPALIKYCVRHSPGTTLFKELSVYPIVANIQDTFKVNRLGKHLISLLPSAESRQPGFPGRVKHSEIP